MGVEAVTDPRALLDAYAAEEIWGGYDAKFPREEEAPKAFAALRAVLDRHQPEPARANAARVGGLCILCSLYGLGKPTRVVVENGREWHEHPSDSPTCTECCADENDTAGVPWPCPTVQDITAALTCDDTA